MQRRNVLFAAVLIGAICTLGAPADVHASVAVSVSVFHEQLTPYGRWVVAGSFGNVWVPRVSAGWAPYVDGEWVYTDYGWTWVSYDPWGDVPCHYGGWAWFDPYGWVWAPGTVWAPAWVTWAYTDDYIGWAPIPPSFAFTATGYVGAPVVVSARRYVFVPTRQFVGVRAATVRVPVESNSVIFAQTVKTTNYRVSGGVVHTAGPPTGRVEKVTAQRIAPVSIERAKTRPTTLAQAGAAKASRISVAAPAAERARVVEQSEGRPEAEKPVKVEKPAKTERTESARAEKSPKSPAPDSKARPSKPSSSSEREAAARPKSESVKPDAPKPESNASTRKAEPKEPKKPAARPAEPPAERPPATSRHEPNREPKGKARAEQPPSAQASKSRPAEPSEKVAPEKPKGPREDTRVASREGRQQPPRSAPKAKPKTPEKKPEPPKEEKPS